VPGGSCGRRYNPLESVTTTCSPCRLGDVAVTTTSASATLVAASITFPVSTPLPWAKAAKPINEVATQTARRAAAKTKFFTGTPLTLEGMEEKDRQQNPLIQTSENTPLSLFVALRARLAHGEPPGFSTSCPCAFCRRLRGRTAEGIRFDSRRARPAEARQRSLVRLRPLRGPLTRRGLNGPMLGDREIAARKASHRSRPEA